MDIDDERSIYYMSEKATFGMQQLYEVLNTQNFQNKEN
jgi:hypothetical protein